ncbi:MAG: sigma-70 family RNA polymerase sigma factor [Deltaproteobacteria bacterium]|nr:sigma-70 family RNA polymerase sigma factor [Deltaproteobacteria bacterium]
MTDEPTSDSMLVQAWRGGDKAAGERLVVRHGPRLYNFFAGKVAEGADQLCQRTFSQCLTDSGELGDGPEPVRQALFRIARVVLLDHLNRLTQQRQRNQHAGRQHPGEPRTIDPEADAIADLGEPVSEVVASRQQQRQLQQALRQLPLDTQIALELHYWEGLSPDAIADIVQAPVARVRQGIEQSRRRLRTLLDAQQAQEDRTIDALATEDGRGSS